MKTIIILLISFVFLSFKTPNHKSLVYHGIALDLDTEEVIYREMHNEVHNSAGHMITQTKFFDSRDNLIAERSLDFSNSKTKPDYTLRDFRTGLLEAVSNKNGIFTITFKENTNEPTIIKTIEVPEPAIVDGGFNYFVKSEWDKLMTGETAYFNFISTARQDYYRFQLTKSENPKHNKKNIIVMKMVPSNYILRALLDPIYITYNAETKRIINYSGISNIKDIEGKNHFATLTYPTVGP